MNHTLLDHAIQLNRLAQPYVLVTLTHIRGSAPQIVGAKMLVTKEGLFFGTVGGGKIEAHSIEFAKNMLSSHGASQSQTWNLQKDIGMSCGGEVTLFFDRSESESLSVAIFGAGHVSQELTRVLSTWNVKLKVIDTRADWLEKLPPSINLERKLSEKMSEEVFHLNTGSYIVCVTMGHSTDVPILAEALKQTEKFPFIGVIGSDVKAIKIRKELLELGLEEKNVKRLISPLGLPLGNNTPPEIAISIAAQLLAFRDQKGFTVNKGLLI